MVVVVVVNNEVDAGILVSNEIWRVGLHSVTSVDENGLCQVLVDVFWKKL